MREAVFEQRVEDGGRHPRVRVYTLSIEGERGVASVAHHLQIRTAEVQFLADAHEPFARHLAQAAEDVGQRAEEAGPLCRLGLDPLHRGGERVHQEVRLDLPFQELEFETRLPELRGAAALGVAVRLHGERPEQSHDESGEGGREVARREPKARPSEHEEAEREPSHGDPSAAAPVPGRPSGHCERPSQRDDVHPEHGVVCPWDERGERGKGQPAPGKHRAPARHVELLGDEREQQQAHRGRETGDGVDAHGMPVVRIVNERAQALGPDQERDGQAEQGEHAQSPPPWIEDEQNAAVDDDKEEAAHEEKREEGSRREGARLVGADVECVEVVREVAWHRVVGEPERKRVRSRRVERIRHVNSGVDRPWHFLGGRTSDASVGPDADAVPVDLRGREHGQFDPRRPRSRGVFPERHRYTDPVDACSVGRRVETPGRPVVVVVVGRRPCRVVAELHAPLPDGLRPILRMHLRRR